MPASVPSKSRLRNCLGQPTVEVNRSRQQWVWIMSVIVAQKQFLFDLIGDFRIAMLVKPRPGAPSIIRPVLVASLEADGHAVVATSQLAAEVDAFNADGDVMLTFQSSDRFAWMRGNATVERSRDAIERYWRPGWIDWFPKGPTESSMCLLFVEGTEGEYWDRRVVGGFGQALESAKAYFVGTTQTECPPHGKVKLAKPRKRPAESTRRRPAQHARAEHPAPPTAQPMELLGESIHPPNAKPPDGT